MHGETVLVEDTFTDPNRGLENPRTVKFAMDEGVRSFMFFPIIIGDEILGAFNVSFLKPHAAGEEEKWLFQALTQRAALQIENARLYEQSQELAVLEERSRLARELHDAVTQTLFSASLVAEALPATWEKNPQEGRGLLQELRGLSRGALAEMRMLLLELRPAALPFDLIVGLLVGNLLAVCSWTFLTAPIATRVRLTLYCQLEKICGRNLVTLYNLANGVMFTFLAGAMITASATALGVWFKFRMLGLNDLLPNSLGWIAAVLAMGALFSVVAAYGYKVLARFANLAVPWMVVVFLAFGIIGLRELGLRCLGDFWTAAQTTIWKGGDPLPGQVKFTFWHVGVGTVRLRQITVSSEGTGALAGARSRATFTIYKACTQSSPGSCGLAACCPTD